MADIIPFGEEALLVRFGGAGEPEIIDHIHSVMAHISGDSRLTEVAAGYDSVMVRYDGLTASRDVARALITDALSAPITPLKGVHHNVPVCYEGIYAPDMDRAADRLGLTADEITARHSAREYRVCMLGFIPGFTFLSAADPSLHMPRHERPRARVAAGSVGIANWQTGIYGLTSPGGWNIIGRTPWPLFNVHAAKPFTFAAGDTVRFVPIPESEFESS